MLRSLPGGDDEALWCVLREKHIYYYAKKAAKTPVGYVDLRRATVSSGAAAGSFKCRESNDAGFWSALGMDAPRFTVKEAARGGVLQLGQF